MENMSNAKHAAVHSSMTFLTVGLACIFLLTVCAFAAGLFS